MYPHRYWLLDNNYNNNIECNKGKKNEGNKRKEGIRPEGEDQGPYLWSQFK